MRALALFAIAALFVLTSRPAWADQTAACHAYFEARDAFTRGGEDHTSQEWGALIAASESLNAAVEDEAASTAINLLWKLRRARSFATVALGVWALDRAANRPARHLEYIQDLHTRGRELSIELSGMYRQAVAVTCLDRLRRVEGSDDAPTPDRPATRIRSTDGPRRPPGPSVQARRLRAPTCPAHRPSSATRPAHPRRYREHGAAHLRRQTRQHPRPPRFHLRTVQQAASVAVPRPRTCHTAHARARADLRKPDIRGASAVSRDARERARVGVPGEGCGAQGCERPALRHDKRCERPLCRRHLCQAIEAWRDANRAAGRCWRCGADKGDSIYRDCDGCRRVNAESCRRYRVRRARLRDKPKARDEWRATAAADERARWLRAARVWWLGKVLALFWRRGFPRPRSVTLPNHLVLEKIQLDIEAAQLGIRDWD